MLRTQVSNYGVHETDEGVQYLHQGSTRSANFIGLSAMSPFEVTTQKACPHMINSSTPMPDREHWKGFMELYKDPLLKQFLPLPRTNHDFVPFVVDADEMLLFLLSKMASPVYPLVHQFQKYSMKRFESDMGLTNIAPLVLTNLKHEHQEQMEYMAKLAKRSVRKLILSGEQHMVITEPMKRVTTWLMDVPTEKLYSLPMENLGAVALRRWARGEQIDSEWVR